MGGTEQTGDALFAEFRAGVQRADPAAFARLLEALRAPTVRDAALWQHIADAMIRAGFTESATRLLDAGIQQHPRAASLRYWRGNALRIGARYELAERDYRAVLHAEPRHRDAAYSLAFMLREQGRIYAAADVVVALLRARAGDAAETKSALGFLRECGAYEPAHAQAEAARLRWPDDTDIAALAGEFALAVGEFDVARDSLRAALDRDPRKSASWLRLAYCKRYAQRDDADLLRIERAWNDRALDALSRTCTGFALGKALDDLSDYAHAAAVLRTANALANSAQHWRLDDWHQFVENQLHAATLRCADRADDFVPIFIIGLPRTGTTLAATLLARDLHVRDRGELNWIGAMYAHLRAQNQMREAAALDSARSIVTAQMRRDDAPARWYLDKNPLNFRYLNLIGAMFPRAKIVHCRRNARDTALSLWMQHFAHEDVGFAYDFATIAGFAQGYERLMAHWRATLALPIFDLDYAELVADAPASMRRLADFLDAPLASTTDSGAPRNTIATASVWQARQPVYTSSIARWKNYATFVPELAQLFADN